MIVLLLLLLFQDTRVLVLQNGKKMTCTSYEISNGRVIILRGGETLALPEKMINWELSKKEEARLAEKNKKKVVEKKAVLRHFPKATKKPVKGIVLTNDNFGEQTGRAYSGSITVGYHTIGNSIIVEATINGQGPFQFILDTGASVTMISPATVARLGISMSAEKTAIVGVSGKPIYVGQTTLETIAVSSARVKGLLVTVRKIGALSEINVVGLLGQDYLNHFTTRLNPANHTLTLSPNGLGTDRVTGASTNTSRTREETEELLLHLHEPYKDLIDVIHEFEDLTISYVKRSGGGSQQSNLRQVKKMSLRLARIRARIRETRDGVDDAKRDHLFSDADNREADNFLRCHPNIFRLIGKVEVQAQSLRKAYSKPGDPRTRAKMSGDLLNRWKKISEAAKDLNGCGR